MNKIKEALLNPVDTKAIFKSAADFRNNPTGVARLFKGLKKDKIDVNDIMQEWLSQGRPDDTRDISKLLSKKFGFNDKEINKVFSKVFGQDKKTGKAEEPVSSPAIKKIADYIRKNGLSDEIKTFMQEEFGKELGISESKMMYEDIKRVFMHIVQEERSDRFELIKHLEQTQLGRIKK
jgi:hypothetical protein